MTEAELVAVAAAGVLLLWWWPPPVRHSVESGPAHRAGDLPFLAQLLAGLSTAADFDAAVASLPPSLRSAVTPATQLRLQQISELSKNAGLPATLLVRQLQREAETAQLLKERWREKAAGSIATSGLLAGMPWPILLAANASGIDAVGWLFGTALGWTALAAGLSLIAISVGRIKRAGRQSRPSRSNRKAVSPTQAGAIGWLAVFALRTDLVGLVLGGIAYALIRQSWSRLRTADEQSRAAELATARPWVSSVLGAALVAGLDWSQAVTQAGQVLPPGLLSAWQDIGRRLQWGVSPEQAFALGPDGWHQIGTIVDQCQRTGAPVAQALLGLAGNWQTELQSSELVRVEQRAANLVVGVALLQLPAFILIGLVPLVAATMLPLLETYTSTGAI